MLSNKEDYLKHIQSVLGPCIAAFGVASSKDVFWKQLNQKLLLLSRHCNVQVSKCLCNTHKLRLIELCTLTFVPSGSSISHQYHEHLLRTIRRRNDCFITRNNSLFGRTPRRYKPTYYSTVIL